MLNRALWAGVVVVLAGCQGGTSSSGPMMGGAQIGMRAFPGSKAKIFDAAVDACIELDMHVVSIDPPRVVNAIAPGRVAGDKVLVNISFMGPQNVTRVSFFNIREGSDQASLLRTRIFDAISRKLGRTRPGSEGAAARRGSRG